MVLTVSEEIISFHTIYITNLVVYLMSLIVDDVSSYDISAIMDYVGDRGKKYVNHQFTKGTYYPTVITMAIAEELYTNMHFDATNDEILMLVRFIHNRHHQVKMMHKMFHICEAKKQLAISMGTYNKKYNPIHMYKV